MNDDDFNFLNAPSPIQELCLLFETADKLQDHETKKYLLAVATTYASSILDQIAAAKPKRKFEVYTNDPKDVN